MFLQAQEDATIAQMPVNLEPNIIAANSAGYFDAQTSGVPISTASGWMSDRRRAVDAGEMVRCIEVRAGRVIVRQVDPVDMNKLEDDPIA